jgi:hypothetical protein
MKATGPSIKTSLAFLLAAVAPGAGWCQTAGAQNAAPQQPAPINPDRPNFTNSPETVAPGRTELEIGYRYTRTGSSKLQEIGDDPTLRMGMTKRFELRLAIPAYAFEDDPSGTSRGFEDGGVGFKWNLSEGSDKFSWAKPKLGLEFDLTLPMGDPPFREESAQPTCQLLSEWDFDAADSLGVALGAARPCQSGQSYNQTVATASVSHQFSQRFTGFVEGFAFLPGDPGGSNDSGFDAGVQYLLSNDAMLDAIVGTPLVSGSPNYFLGVGISLRW